VSSLTDIEYDESRWPFVVVTKGPAVQSDAEFEQHLAKLRSYFQRGHGFGLVFDVRRAPILTADQRRILAERMDADIAEFGPLLCGVALVVSSGFSRGMLKAILWLRKSREPNMMPFADIGSALVWLSANLRQKLHVRPQS
jgi:hypothetical protein